MKQKQKHANDQGCVGDIEHPWPHVFTTDFGRALGKLWNKFDKVANDALAMRVNLIWVEDSGIRAVWKVADPKILVVRFAQDGTYE